MEKILRGKYLIRKSTTSEGNKVITLTGVFHPRNFDINEINDNDEMWVSDLIVSTGGIRYTDPVGIDGGSPEDFLEGNNQSPKCWNNKTSL